MDSKPAIVAVSGKKNSGKTTFLCNIIPLLKEKGLRVAAVKHDGHKFDPDVPGTDSYKLRHAGADGVAIYTDDIFMVLRRQANIPPEELFRFFSDFDLILLEGAKNSPYPKIEIVRAENSKTSVCDPATLLAVCTDADLLMQGVRRIGLSDYGAAVDIIIKEALL